MAPAEPHKSPFKATRRDPVLGAEGAVTALERLSEIVDLGDRRAERCASRILGREARP